MVRRPPTSRSKRTFAILGVFAITAMTPTTSAAQSRVLSVAPGADGDCLAHACGSLAAAYQIAAPGDVIELAAGQYGSQDVPARPEAAQWTENVTVRPARGANVTTGWLRIAAAGLTVQGLHVQGAVTLTPDAHNTRLEQLVVDGPMYLIGAENMALTGSTIRPPRDEDALQIKPSAVGTTVPRNVVVADNDLGPALITPGSSAHADSVQVMGVDGLRFERNRVREADSLSMLVKPDLGPITDVVVRDNVFEQCQPRRADCNGYYGLMVRSNTPDDVRGVLVEQNTFGAADFDQDDRFTIRYNVFTLPIAGHAGLTHNLAHPDSTGLDSTNILARAELTPEGAVAPGSPGHGWGARSATGSRPVASPFSDVMPGHTHHDAVVWMADHGITRGTSDGRFDPQATVTRGQAATLLWRLAGEPSTNASMTFRDVPGDAHFAPAVRWLTSTGVVRGVTADRFAPSAPVTRGQAASLLWRFAGSPPVAGGHPFDDVHASAHYDHPVAWKFDHGLTRGVTPTAYAGARPVTRGQMASFLYRMAGTEDAWSSAALVPPVVRF